MAHFVSLNQNNKVLNVFRIANEDMLNEKGEEVEALGILKCEELFGPGKYLQTSYEGNFRVRFAGMGDFYDETLDAFIPPKVFDSWIFNNLTYDYDPPVPKPTDVTPTKDYIWNEETKTWDEIDDGGRGPKPPVPEN